jgi:hypothetical protein
MSSSFYSSLSRPGYLVLPKAFQLSWMASFTSFASIRFGYLVLPKAFPTMVMKKKFITIVWLFSCPPTFESELSSLCCMKKASSDYRRRLCIEVPSGFEPLWELLQSSA